MQLLQTRRRGRVDKIMSIGIWDVFKKLNLPMLQLTSINFKCIIHASVTAVFGGQLSLLQVRQKGHALFY